ncbi:MAG: hypothetical protein WC107_07970 [Patescibacteria group bacterium]|jgi:hypothetical protein
MTTQRTLHTVEIWDSSELQTIKSFNNRLKAESLYLETLQHLQAGQTIKLVQAPQNILKTHTKRG